MSAPHPARAFRQLFVVLVITGMLILGLPVSAQSGDPPPGTDAVQVQINATNISAEQTPPASTIITTLTTTVPPPPFETSDDNPEEGPEPTDTPVPDETVTHATTTPPGPEAGDTPAPITTITPNETYTQIPEPAETPGPEANVTLIVTASHLIEQVQSSGTTGDSEPESPASLKLTKDTLPGNKKRLSPSLIAEMDTTTADATLMQQTTESGLILKTAPNTTAIARGLKDNETYLPVELVYVYIYTFPGYPTRIVDPYAAEVTGRSERDHLVVAWVDIAKLTELANVEGIKVIREVIPPVVRMGSVTTEGDVVHSTADVRSSYSESGAGIKIGVISDGVGGLDESIASGDLPADLQVLSNKRGGAEGTAMLEIIYDMVPEADLYFHDCGSNILEFNDAIDALIASGCTVIVDDIGWTNEPFFGDGIVATHVSEVIGNNTLVFVSAAGNDAEKHYQGFYHDNPITDDFGQVWHFHDFSSGGSPSYKYMYVVIPPGGYVNIILNWDEEWGSAANDYDLFLRNYNDETEYLGVSNYDNIWTTEPYERIYYYNSGSTTKTGQIEVFNDDADPRTLELFIYTGKGASLYSNNVVADDAIYGHPAVPGAIAVAAVKYSTPSTIESFSSLGPVTIAFPEPEIRIKPDITGVDGVKVTGHGGFSTPFFGTSAAAPHVAAVAAQIWGSNPTLTPAQVKSALYSSALDLGDGGKDTTFGYGRADAWEMFGIMEPVADFTATPVKGTSPLVVQFNDASTWSPTSYLWDFGDGGTAFGKDPVHTYNAVGTYTVNLAVSNPAGSDTEIKTGYITVQNTGSLVAEFAANTTSGTAPLTVQFTDLSAGSPVTYAWTFGDGGSSVARNPVHTFNAPGMYNVSLIITDAGAATDTEVKTGYIEVHQAGTVADFTANTTAGTFPLAVQFTDLSAGNPTTFAWTFGDGGSSADQNPVHTYATAGLYTVKLTTTNAAGSDTETKIGYIKARDPGAPVAQFTQDVTTGPYPLAVQFTDQSSGTPTDYLWHFGDGDTATAQDPAHTYLAPGTFTVKLTATNAAGSDSIAKTKLINVPYTTPTADFVANITSGTIPRAVKFYDLSSDYPSSWFWDFGDGGTSTEQDPVHTYTVAGNYTVNLTASNSAGTDVEVKADYIQVMDIPPTANFTANITSGTYPLPVRFNDTSTGNPRSWLWDFGDGNTSSLQNPVNTYGWAGNFTVNLTVTNSAGADSEERTDYIVTQEQPPAPVVSFTATPVAGAVPLTVVFTDTSTNSPTTWNWSFGDGSDVNATEQNPVHRYSDAGTYTVSLNVSNAYGYGNLTLQDYITVAAWPTVTSVNPATATLNNTINVTIMGQNFQTGAFETWANFTYITGGQTFDNRNLTLTDVTTTRINATMILSPGMPTGNWNVTVTTVNGGQSTVRSDLFTVIPHTRPSITTVEPGTALLNTTVNFTVNGENFQSGGMTWINFTKGAGAGIFENRNITLTQITTTKITGTMDINPDMPTGSWNVTVTTVDGGQSTVRSDLFNVNPYPQPAVTLVSPKTAMLNNTFNFTVTGTQFRENGMTRVNFTRGVFDNLNLTISTVTNSSISGTMTIGQDQPTGNWNVTVTTVDGGQSTVRSDLFTVIPYPRPTITTVVPGTALVNTTVNFTINGENYRTGGMTWINFTKGAGAGIFDNRNVTLTQITTTKITGTMDLNTDMPTGKWNLTVTTVDGGASAKKLSAITVSRFPAPVVTSVSPVSGYPNSTVTYTILGSNFIPGQTTVYFSNKTGSTLNVTALTSVTTTRINGTLMLPQNAPVGSWNLDVATVDSGRNGTKLSAFTVTKVLAPTMGTLTPSSGSRNTTTEFVLTGTNFQTGAGKTFIRVYEDVMDTDLPVTITSVTATKITGTFIAGAGASPGSYIVEVTTVDGGTVSRAGGYRIVQAAIPTISSITPTGGYRNDTVAYTVKGTGFQPDKTTIVLKNQTTSAVLGTMTADSVTATIIRGNLTIPVAAPTGYYRLDVTTVDGGVVNRINAFRVDAVKTPTMGSITPTIGFKNTTVAFTLTGTNFQTGSGQTTVAIVDDTSGTNLAATIYTVTSTKIIGSFTIPAGTPPGKYRLELTTTDGGTVAKADAFTVNYLPLPTISSLTPTSGNQGSTVKFTLKGKDFLDDGTFVQLRAPGNTITGVLSSVNSTMIIGNFTIPGVAGTGYYRLDVYTVSGGINSKTNAFTVK